MALASAPVPAPDLLSKQEQRHLGVLEKRIAAGLQTFREVGQALLEIRDSRLYRDTHPTFEAYCVERWAMERSRAYQLIDSAKVVNALGDPEALTNEAQAREMAPLLESDPAVAKQVWTAVEKRAEESHRPLTAALIREVREEVAPANGNGFATVAVVTPTDRLMTDMVRLGAAYKRWQDSKPNIGQRNKVKVAVTQLVAIIKP